MFRFSLSAAMLAAFCMLAPGARGGLITGSGGFLPTYTGPQTPDLEVSTAQVFFNPSTSVFTFTATLDAAPVTGDVYVWGINTGSNVAPFGAFATNVLFDSVLILQPGSTSFVDSNLITASPLVTDLTSGQVTISGDTITATFAASLLPSDGFTPQNYGVAVWPRDGLALGAAGLPQIAQFSPSNTIGDASVTVTPEPASGLLFASAIVIGALMRRSRTRRRAATVTDRSR
jgi:hypothetical protein